MFGVDVVELLTGESPRLKNYEIVRADCERDNFMTAEEAVEYGLIDKVIYKR